MNYLLLCLIIVISLEIIQKFNYLFLVNSLIQLNKKAYQVILNKKVSDNWKEKIIPEYSLKILKISILMILVPIFLFFIFYLTSLFFNNFQNFIFSIKGILASILISFGYVYSKNLMKK